MSWRYSQHDDRCEPEEKGSRLQSYKEEGRYERTEARAQGRSKIEPPRFNKYSGHDDRVERDDNEDGVRRHEGGQRGWDQPRSGRTGRDGQRADGTGREGGYGGGGRGGGFRGPAGDDSKSGRRDGHDDRDTYDYTAPDPRGAQRRNGGGMGE
ncbi:hypothetical protein Vretimale_16852 [Volvox reticuliferus]|uniref:Uncharacterized protein n=1 Tax=Volvox reticuliferus TaxID=1737510 RepID=A0A8J4GTT0_9CHLO|nr:hypothetical protein Vretimale_16852 [Volvox reticuliferus]